MNCIEGWMIPKGTARETRFVEFRVLNVNSRRSPRCGQRLDELVTVWVFDQALSVPVLFHCRANWTGPLGNEYVTTSARGIVTTQTSASSGDIQNIIPMTPRW